MARSQPSKPPDRNSWAKAKVPAANDVPRETVVPKGIAVPVNVARDHVRKAVPAMENAAKVPQDHVESDGKKDADRATGYTLTFTTLPDELSRRTAAFERSARSFTIG